MSKTCVFRKTFPLKPLFCALNTTWYTVAVLGTRAFGEKSAKVNVSSSWQISHALQHLAVALRPTFYGLIQMSKSGELMQPS